MARSEAPASAKAAGNSYPLCLPPPRQSSTLPKVQIRPPKGVIETSPVGVLVFNARTGDLVSLNREARRIVESLCAPGQSAEQLLKVITYRRADGREIALDQLPLAGALSGAETVRAEEIVLSVPDGRSITTLVNATPIHDPDGPAGAVASVVVTLQDLAPLRELERMRAEFLGMVSHELRAPLTSIGGPPCQGFTRANRKRGPNDPRNPLVFEFARLVVELRPHSFCLENVPEMAKMRTPDGIKVVDQFEAIIREGGYNTYDALDKLRVSRPEATAVHRRADPKDIRRSTPEARKAGPKRPPKAEADTCSMPPASSTDAPADTRRTAL